MKSNKVPYNPFTTYFTGRVGVLTNEIQVSDAYDPTQGGPQPDLKPYKCIWDTGATGTVVTQKVVAELNLSPSGKIRVQGVGPGHVPNIHETNTYLVNLYLPNQVGLIGVKVSEGSIGAADVLIGMDVITQGDFAVSNHEKKTAFTFRVPSCGKIDFVEDHKRQFGPTDPSLFNRSREHLRRALRKHK